MCFKNVILLSSVLHLLLMWSQYCHYYNSLVAQLCLTLCNSMDFASPPDSSVQGIIQARILEWVSIPFSRGFSDLGIQSRLGFPGGPDSKKSAWNTGDLGLIPGSGRFTREGNGHTLQPGNFAWEIPWMEEPGRLYSPWDCKESELRVFTPALQAGSLLPKPPGKPQSPLFVCICMCAY